MYITQKDIFTAKSRTKYIIIIINCIYITVIAPRGNQEGVDEIVNKSNTSLLNAPTVAANRYGGTLK